MNLTYSMFSDNYAYFYKLMTGESSSLLLKDNSVEILVKGKVCDVTSISGGQKTVIVSYFCYSKE